MSKRKKPDYKKQAGILIGVSVIMAVLIYSLLASGVVYDILDYFFDKLYDLVDYVFDKVLDKLFPDSIGDKVRESLEDGADKVSNFAYDLVNLVSGYFLNLIGLNQTFFEIFFGGETPYYAARVFVSSMIVTTIVMIVGGLVVGSAPILPLIVAGGLVILELIGGIF